MSNDPQTRIDEIRTARKDKGGRMTKAEKEEIELLESMMDPSEPEPEPASAGAARGRILSANLTCPSHFGNVNYPEGSEVEVPEDFLDAMVEAGRMERV